VKIGVVGAGAMGSLFGGKLARSGQEVLLFDVNRAHMERVREQGLVIEELATGRRESCHPRATTEPKELRDAEVLLVFVKSWATEAVSRQIAPIAAAGSIAITLQNGLGNESILKHSFGPERTAAGVTSQGATFLGPGLIRHAGRGPTHLCASDGRNDKLAGFAAALNAAGLETRLESSIDSLVWSKLVINAGINALTALTGLPNGRLLELPETRELMAALVSEAAAVAAARGIALAYPDPVETTRTVARDTGGNRSSMLQDFDQRRPSEIDSINGAVLREAEALGLPAPVNRAVTLLVRAMDALHAQAQGAAP
jgi:2-dehydropantoate 2-reductase